MQKNILLACNFVNLLKISALFNLKKITMKNFLLFTVISGLLFVSCKTSHITSYTDDAYVNPTEIKKLAQQAAEERAEKESQKRQKQEEERLAQKAKDDSNPYYQDPNYNQDDYYDYQYASRINRFNSPLAGAGYYDPYYTNMYTYNQNPAMYGTSIYSSYNYGMPSYQFNTLSLGFSNGFNSGYGYNSYGYNGYYSNNYCNSMYGNNYGGYSPYYCGGNLGYGYGINPYSFSNYGYYPFSSNYYGNNSGWGYFNSFDPNSTRTMMEYGVRGSSTSAGTAARGSGENIMRETDNSKQRFFESVNQQQTNTPRFSESNSGRGNTRMNNGSSIYENSNGNNTQNESRTRSNSTNSQRMNGTNQSETRSTSEERTNRNNSSTRMIENKQNSNSENNASRTTNSGSSTTSPRNSSGGSTGGGNRPR